MIFPGRILGNHANQQDQADLAEDVHIHRGNAWHDGGEDARNGGWIRCVVGPAVEAGSEMVDPIRVLIVSAFSVIF